MIRNKIYFFKRVHYINSAKSINILYGNRNYIVLTVPSQNKIIVVYKLLDKLVYYYILTSILSFCILIYFH